MKKIKRRDFLVYSSGAGIGVFSSALLASCGLESNNTNLKTQAIPTEDLPDIEGFDVDGDGVLTGDEIVQFLRSIEVTAVEDFYVQSYGPTPEIAEADYQLRILGAVGSEQTLTLADLQALEQFEQTATLICIGNSVGGQSVGNANWRGPRLQDVLDLAGVDSSAIELILRGADGYSDSFPIEKVEEEGVIVALEMNGAPLNARHGFPARVIVPNLYGIKNVKWLLELEAATENHLGYWQDRGWDDEGKIKTASRSDLPGNGVKAQEVTFLSGIAFAGTRGVGAVEVSFDGGDTWEDANVLERLSRYAWNIWWLPWEPNPGSYNILVRAYDEAGEEQIAEVQGSFPDGATGYDEHSISLI